MNDVDSIELIFAIVAVIIGGIALCLSTISLALIVGVKNSTHQVVWKPLDEPRVDEADQFTEDGPDTSNVLNNPNKKFKNEIPKEEPEFADLSSPEVTSNQW